MVQLLCGPCCVVTPHSTIGCLLLTFQQGGHIPGSAVIVAELHSTELPENRFKAHAAEPDVRWGCRLLVPQCEGHWRGLQQQLACTLAKSHPVCTPGMYSIKNAIYTAFQSHKPPLPLSWLSFCPRNNLGCDCSSSSAGRRRGGSTAGLNQLLGSTKIMIAQSFRL